MEALQALHDLMQALAFLRYLAVTSPKGSGTWRQHHDHEGIDNEVLTDIVVDVPGWYQGAGNGNKGKPTNNAGALPRYTQEGWDRDGH